MGDIKILYKRLGEIDADGCVRGVPGLRLDKNYVTALRENPFREGKDVVCVKVGIVDERVAGREYVFPLSIMCDDMVVSAGSGSCTTVEKWARKTGLGIELSSMKEDCRDGDFKVGECAGLSQVAVKIRKYLNQPVFEYPRYIGLLKCRAVVETKLNGILAKMVSWIGDAVLGIITAFGAAYARVMSSGYVVEPVSADREGQLREMESLARSEKCRFCEVHDARWFKWVLTNSFSSYGPPVAYIVRRNNVAIGFFMVKKRFHEQASHRGFRDVWLGSIVEWATLDAYKKFILWKIYIWYYRSRKELDAVEFPAAERWVVAFLKRHGWQKVGNANFCYNIRSGTGYEAPIGMDNAENWRLRPGMGDCAIN